MTRSSKVSADSRQDTWLQKLGLDSYVALDLETTGLDPSSEQIIEIGAVRFKNGEVENSFQTLLHCDKALDPFIVGLTGIKDSDLKRAPRFKSIAQRTD